MIPHGRMNVAGTGAETITGQNEQAGPEVTQGEIACEPMPAEREERPKPVPITFKTARHCREASAPFDDRNS